MSRRDAPLAITRPNDGLAIVAPLKKVPGTFLGAAPYRPATPMTSAFQRIDGRTGAGTAPVTRVLVAT